MGNRSTLEAERPPKAQKSAKKAAAGAKGSAPERERIFDAFRRWGYNEANLDPLAEEARRIYCGTIGAEFMHLPPERRQWIAARIEGNPTEVDQRKILERL